MFRLLPVLLLLSCKPPPDPAPPGVEGPDQPLTDQPFTTLQGVITVASVVGAGVLCVAATVLPILRAAPKLWANTG